MKVLFISSLSSRKVIDSIYETTRSNPGFAIQKFSRLIAQGFVSNDIAIRILTVPPITRRESKRVWVNLKNEEEDGIDYRYIPFINLIIIKHICVFIYSFFYVLFWGLSKKEKKIVVCDVLSISNCYGALIASKINRVNNVAIVTDIYSKMVGKSEKGVKLIIQKLAGFLQHKYSTSFTHYVLLTEAMNRVVNPHNRPFIVMEALCDITSPSDKRTNKRPNQHFTFLYAGGIEEKYGLKALVEGFRKIQRDDVRLVIYGSGTYVKELESVCKEDARIIYNGVVSNEEIIKAEYEADILVNPRYTAEEFTKYSFPSKNMEYMVSGTPVLTTMLPGMPKDYYPYVFLFDQGESVEGYYSVLQEITNKDDDELVLKGQQARDYVLEHKNNIVQTKRIIELVG